MTEIFGNGVDVFVTVEGGDVHVRVTGADIGEPGEHLGSEARRERERIALSKLSDADKALLDDPTLLSIAKKDNKSPAEVLVWLREGEEKLELMKSKAVGRTGTAIPKRYGRSMADY
jgi:hypothetical protein